MQSEKLIIVGAGGHARLLKDIFDPGKALDVIFVIEKNLVQEGVENMPNCLISENLFFQNYDEQLKIINGVGPSPNNKQRAHVYNKFQKRGFKFCNVISENAIITGDTQFGNDVQILAGVIVNNRVEIGHGTVINTGAIIEHDCKIGCHVHIAPGAIVCGDAEIGDYTYVGPGAVIARGVIIGSDVTIGANSTILSNIGKSEKVYGVHHD